MGNTFKTGNYVNGIFQDASNNIGIGAAPSGSYKLEVTGTAKVSSTLLLGGALNIGSSATTGKQLIVNQTGASGYFLSGEASGTEIAYWYYDASTIQFSSKASARALTFLTTDTERMRITSAGNVGISTSSPNLTAANRTVLDINGTTTSLLSFSSGGTNKGYLYNDGTNLTINTSGVLAFEAGSAERMRITSGGLVGIGTSTPTSYINQTGCLAVVGNTISNFGISIDNGYSAGANGTSSLFLFSQGALKVRLDYARDLDAGIMGTVAAIPMLLFAGGSERMRITSGGNVGIGTVGSSNARLTVAGVDASTSNYSLVVNNNTTSLFYVRNDGLIFAPGIYNNTNSNLPNVWVNSDGSLYRSTSSSIRYKENINDWNGSGLDTILALKPKTFKYKKDYYNLADVDFLGLIAEEVAEVSPYLAEYENQDRSGQVENVRYATIVVPLIKAIQELNERLNKAGL